MNRLTNFCASDLLSHILFYMETKDKFLCQEVLAQLKIIMLIVHVIVILADNGEKSVLVFRVHFFLKLKNQFMKMHLFHVHMRYVYYLLNQKNCHIKCFPLSQANCKNVIWRFAVGDCHMGKRLVIRYQI